MQKYAAVLSYVGTRYCGWQIQKGSNQVSVQETIAKVLKQMTGEDAPVVGSGRTDAGVHAAGQVAHFALSDKEWEEDILMKGMNALLPQAIKVLALKKVSPEFHAQRQAVRKQYSYYFQQGPAPLPFFMDASWWIKRPLNLRAMQEGLDLLWGRHDFKPFQASGGVTATTEREIYRAKVRSEMIPFPATPLSTYSMVRVTLEGNGFLKQMVRGIVGTLLEIGEERRTPYAMKEILQTKDRRLVGPTAPARGLWLEKVHYYGIDW